MEASPKVAPSGVSLRFSAGGASGEAASAALNAAWPSGPSAAVAALQSAGAAPGAAVDLVKASARFHMEASRHFGYHGPHEDAVAEWLAAADGKPFLRRTVTIAGMELTLLEQAGINRPFQVAARASVPPAATLAAVLSTVWIYSDGPQGLLSQIGEAEGGQQWEEVVGWETVGGGLVEISYLEDRYRIPGADFHAAARAMAEFHLEVARLREADGPRERLIRDWLAKSAR